jgi:hypothetical protein
MRRNLVISGLVVALVAPLGAQQQAAEQGAANLKAQITAFEGVLRGAVEQGGQRLARWAAEVVPTVELVQAEEPKARGVPLPDASVFFDVQIPVILQTNLMLWNLYQQQRSTPATPVARNDRVTATGVVPADPMVAGAVLMPDEQYSNFVREALIEAMLSSAGVLSLEDGQWLTVAASGADVFVRNPLYRNQSRKLILSILGEDLRALRAGEITVDEARSRIVERRF